MEPVLLPFMFLCLNGCYGPPQALRGQVERLPQAESVAPLPPTSMSIPAAPGEPSASNRLPADELLRLAEEIKEPEAWAERIFAGGRPDLAPSSLIELNRRGVPVAHLDALYAREMRAREADAAGRVAEREQYLGRRYEDDLRRHERMRYSYPAYPTPMYPGYPFAPYGGFWMGWP